MKPAKLLYIPLALLILFCANLRPVCRVSVDGAGPIGSFSPSSLRLGMVSAMAAAEEIARQDAALPAVTSDPALSLRAPEGDGLALCRAVLERTEGVGVAWRVYVGGLDAGLCSDPSALGEVIDSIVARGAVEEAVTACLTEDVELKRYYVPSGADTDLMALSARLQDMTEVMSVTSGGVVRYG